MILSNTLYKRNRNQIFTITHTILNTISAVTSISAKNDAKELAIIIITCNHIEMKLCFRKLSYLQSLKSLSSMQQSSLKLNSIKPN